MQRVVYYGPSIAKVGAEACTHAHAKTDMRHAGMESHTHAHTNTKTHARTWTRTDAHAQTRRAVLEDGAHHASRISVTDCVASSAQPKVCNVQQAARNQIYMQRVHPTAFPASRCSRTRRCSTRCSTRSKSSRTHSRARGSSHAHVRTENFRLRLGGGGGGSGGAMQHPSAPLDCAALPCRPRCAVPSQARP